MLSGKAITGLLWTALAIVLMAKMVLLEPFTLSLQGLQIVIVAALLPVALLIRWSGVAVITAACGLAHWVNDGSLSDALIAAVAVGLATGSANLVLQRRPDTLRWITAGWIITAQVSIVMAAGHALISGVDPLTALYAILSGVWFPINFIGVPAAALLGRLSRSFGLRYDSVPSGPEESGS